MIGDKTEMPFDVCECAARGVNSLPLGTYDEKGKFKNKPFHKQFKNLKTSCPSIHNT